MQRIRAVFWLTVIVSALAAACSDDSSSTGGAPDAADAGGDAPTDVDASGDVVDDGGADADAANDVAGDPRIDVDDATDTRDDAADARDDASDARDDAADVGADPDAAGFDSGDDAADAGIDAADAEPDADGDGVPDASDVCDGSDDTVDLNDDDVPDCSQNALPNGGFDGTIDPWQGADYEPARDANEMAASGSARLSFPEGGPFLPFVAHCQRVEPGSYGLYAQALVPSGQDAEADTRFYVQSYREPFCPLSDGYVELLNRIMETPTDTWTTLSGQLTVTPERPYLAIYINLEPTADANLDGFVDNVLLVPEDPVE